MSLVSVTGHVGFVSANVTKIITVCLRKASSLGWKSTIMFNGAIILVSW